MKAPDSLFSDEVGSTARNGTPSGMAEPPICNPPGHLAPVTVDSPPLGGGGGGGGGKAGRAGARERRGPRGAARDVLRRCSPARAAANARCQRDDAPTRHAGRPTRRAARAANGVNKQPGAGERRPSGARARPRELGAAHRELAPDAGADGATSRKARPTSCRGRLDLAGLAETATPSPAARRRSRRSAPSFVSTEITEAPRVERRDLPSM